MKSTIAALVVSLAFGSALQAADEEKKPKKPVEKKTEAGLPELDAVQKLDLGKDQKDSVSTIQKEFREKVEAARKKFTDAIEQGKQNKDREKFQQAAKAFQEEVGKLREDLQGRLKKVLNEEQQRRLAELQQRFGKRFDILPQLVPAPLQQRLDLTAEQKDKLDKLQKEVEEKVRGILTDEQKKRLDEFQKGGKPEIKKEKKPGEKKPDAKKPDAKKPEVKKPDTKKPGNKTKKPVEKKPEVKKPDAERPEVKKEK